MQKTKDVTDVKISKSTAGLTKAKILLTFSDTRFSRKLREGKSIHLFCGITKVKSTEIFGSFTPYLHNPSPWKYLSRKRSIIGNTNAEVANQVELTIFQENCAL